MITQTIRVENNSGANVFTFGSVLFLNLNLYELTTLPAWITYVNTGSPLYTKTLTITPTTLGTYYYYFTLAGSPMLEDALLIVEVVDSLTEDIDTCIKQDIYLVDSVTDNGGNAQINTLYDISVMPKVNDYVYISSGIYLGYHKIVWIAQYSTIVIDTPYIGTSTPNVYLFNLNTSICLVWINRDGGRSSSIFDQRRNYGNTLGEVKNFDNNGSLKTLYRGKIYDNKVVYKTGLQILK